MGKRDEKRDYDREPVTHAPSSLRAGESRCGAKGVWSFARTVDCKNCLRSLASKRRGKP